MKHRHVVSNNGGLPDYDGMRVIDHHALSNARTRMNIDPEGLRCPHLNEVGHVRPTPPPQPVRQSITLEGLEPFEEEQRLQIAVAGRVTLIDGNDISAGRYKDLGIILIGLIRQLTEDQIAHFLGGKLLGNPETQGTGKAAVMENPRMNCTRHQGFGNRNLLGFPADDGPNAIKTRDARLRLGQS